MLNKLFPCRFSPLNKTHRTIFHFTRSLPQTDDDDDDDLPFTPISNQKNSSSPVKDPTQKVSSDLPFDFVHSYSETDLSLNPIGFRESPKFSPFGPGRLDRAWTGTAAPGRSDVDPDDVARERECIIGEPLSEEEVLELVERYRHNDCSRQINLGREGLTHNALDDVHNHWKRNEAVRIKCLGVPTLDMDNICSHLEEKTGGKIIYRHINVLLLYRGRYYDPKNRPTIPLMLWKPYRPIYPRLVKNVVDGLTPVETKELRKQGLNSHPLMILTRNGAYTTVVERVRQAFGTDEVLRLDCKHVGSSDCKRIGVKLRNLVPCVPILIKDEQIILWRGKIDGDKAAEALACEHVNILTYF